MPLQRRIIPFLLLYFALALHAAWAKSPTNDESVHIFRAHVLVHSNDLRFQLEHPPLSHRLIGTLLRTERTLPLPEALPSWGTDASRLELAREMLWNGETNVRRAVFIGRIPIILGGMVLGALLLRWTKQSLVMATLWAFAPNWLAHSALATTDALLVVTFATAVWAVVRLRDRPTAGRLMIAAIAVGLTLATKVTGILILPVSGLLLLTTWRPSRAWLRTIGQWLALLPLAALTVWLVYGFEWRSVPYFDLPLPAATYIDSIRGVFEHVDGGHFAFLLGEISEDGWWHYFAVAFLVKTPLPLLILLVLALVTLAQQRQLWRRREAWLPAVLLFAIATYTRLNIGYRHILTMLPFLWLLVAVASTQWRSQTMRRLLAGLLVWYALATVWQAPDFLAYFNGFGRTSAAKLLGDSNLDWGQDLWTLRDYVAASDSPVTVSYSGFPDANYYADLTTLSIDPDNGEVADFANANPQPGRYAISVSHLQGATIREKDAFAWFREQTPIARLGGSIYVYDVLAAQTGDWIAHCSAPVPSVSAEKASQLVGRNDLRQLYFDCTQSWVYPEGAGWYILPSEAAAAWLPSDAWGDWEAVYTHRANQNAADYVVIYAAEKPALAAGWQRTAQAENGASVGLPQAFEDVAELTGYQHLEPTWLTLWAVRPHNRPTLSIMAHLYDNSTIPLVVGDGLGFTSDQWQAGDLLLQRHALAPIVSCANGELVTGIYDFVTSERLTTPASATLRLPAVCRSP